MANSAPHTVSSYDDELHRLRSVILQMGALCDAQLTAAIDAIAEADAPGAQAVVALDARADALYNEAQEAAVGIFVRHAPLADDLREVVATLKIAGWLERAADHAKNIARRGVDVAGLDAAEAAALVLGLGGQAKALLRAALEAYSDRDAVQASAVIAGDAAIDASYAAAFEGLLEFTRSHPAALTATTHLQFIAKNFERIADEATNIAEQVRYAVSGEIATPRETTPLPVVSAG